METKVELIKSTKYITSKWSGGTTSELLIYPDGSKYSERNFKWRISSAKIEASKSLFTQLPGITRHIMVIDGKIILEHQDRYKKVLGPFDKDSFMGVWETKSYGKATDFNLMLTNNFAGDLEAYFIEEEQVFDIAINESSGKNVTNVFYVLNGSVEIDVNKKKFNIEEKDLLYVTGLSTGEKMIRLANRSICKLVVIRALIWG
ncbi:HutD family protein [Thermodesulfobium sp. 4217-1]|uniref:HutD family protein n=1 Tax=Thermodesulfobium sp. 4217-1 TaxID=3120013 RepID=UPI0032214499